MTNIPKIPARCGQQRTTVRDTARFLAAILACFCLALPVVADNKGAPTSALARIEAVVARRLAGDKTYAPGDLISRADVEPIVNELLKMGFQSPDNEELYDSILPENDRLVRLLKTPAGTKFMRHVSAMPGVYDRLERLSWTAEGRKLLEDLFQRPDGPKLLQAMTTPAGAQAVAQSLSADSRSKNFLLPTGHIHTADELLAWLRKTYGKQQAAH